MANKEMTVTMYDGEKFTASSKSDARKKIKERVSISCFVFLDSANGYIVSEGSKKYPRGDPIAWINKDRQNETINT